jgi:uncharacterized membrane protein YvbJ
VTGAIITVVCTIVVFWLKRRIAIEGNEQKQAEKKINKIDKAIADGDENDVNALLDAALRVPDKSRGDSGGQGGQEGRGE